MKYRSLLDSLPLVAESLGRSRHVRVTIGDTRMPCVTNDHHIHLPPLDPDDEETLVLARGWLDHEVGHIKHTDFSVMKKAGDRANARMLNLLEDVRQERLMGNEYPGCERNLDRVWAAPRPEELKSPGSTLLSEVPMFDWDIEAVVEAHILQRLRAQVLKQSFAIERTAATEQVLAARTSPSWMAGLNALVDETGALASTAQALSLAKRIVKYLRKAAHGKTSQPKSGKDDQGGEQGNKLTGSGNPSSKSASSQSDKGTGNGQGSGVNEDARGTQDGKDAGQGQRDEDQPDAQGGKRKAENQQDAGDRSCGTGQSSGEDASGDDGSVPVGYEGKSNAIDPLQAAEDALQKASQRAVQNKTAVSVSSEPYGRAGGAGQDVASHGLVGTPVDYQKVIGTTSALRSRVLGLLQAEKLRRTLPARHGRILITRRLARTKVGEDRIFATFRRQEGPNTLVTVLVDRSGSMNGWSLHLAMESALAVSLALGEIRGVRTACYAFPGVRSDAVIPLVRLGETPVACRGRFIPCASGGTPMLEALWHITRATALEPEPRKLLFVVTDGQPNRPEATRDLLDRLGHERYEPMGIGIGIDIRDLIAHSVRIAGVGDLAQKMFEMLTEALLRYKKKLVA